MQVINHNFRGTLSFGNDVTSPNTPSVTLTSLEAFLEGIPDGGKQVQGDSLRHTFQNSHGLFIQDSFRATSRLTLNYGLRWDYFGVTGEKNGLFYTVDFSNGGNNVPTNQLYDKDLNNFAPRVAFAYDVSGKGKTVVRAGWGVFYDAFSQDMFLGHLPWNCTFCPGPAYPGLGPKRWPPAPSQAVPWRPTRRSMQTTDLRGISSPSIRRCARRTSRTSI